MWPKAFAQLVELAPHISRLLPMADRFFQSKTAGDDTSRKTLEAMEALNAALRDDLGQVTAAHTGLGKQLGHLDVKLDAVASDVRAAKLAVESMEGRLNRTEARQSRVLLLLAVVLIAVCVLQVLILAHAR